MGFLFGRGPPVFLDRQREARGLRLPVVMVRTPPLAFCATIGIVAGMQPATQASVIYAAIARNLREFGYPDVTADMVAGVHEAMRADEPLPHGIVGMFASGEIEEAEAKGLLR